MTVEKALKMLENYSKENTIKCLKIAWNVYFTDIRTVIEKVDKYAIDIKVLSKNGEKVGIIRVFKNLQVKTPQINENYCQLEFLDENFDCHFTFEPIPLEFIKLLEEII